MNTHDAMIFVLQPLRGGGYAYSFSVDGKVPDLQNAYAARSKVFEIFHEMIIPTVRERCGEDPLGQFVMPPRPTTPMPRPEFDVPRHDAVDGPHDPDMPDIVARQQRPQDQPSDPTLVDKITSAWGKNGRHGVAILMAAGVWCSVTLSGLA